MSIIIFAITEAMAVFEVCIVTVILYKQLCFLSPFARTNPAFEEEEEEEGEENSVSVTPTGSTEALTKGKTSAKPPPVSREHPPAQPQRPVERSELDSEEDSQLSEEESESEPESVAPPEKVTINNRFLHTKPAFTRASFEVQ